jgi:hypothetical protein
LSTLRRVELVQQIEEMRLLVSEQQSALPAKGRQNKIPSGIIEERLERQAGILATLEFLKDHEPEFRAWHAANRLTQPVGETQ